MPNVGPIRLPLPAISSLTAPLRLATAVGGMAAEAFGGPPRRRCSTNGARHWIEVRGLDEIGETVLSTLCATPGVTDVSLNTTVARVVVTVDEDGPALSDLCAVVAG